MPPSIRLVPALLLALLSTAPAGAAVNYQQDFETDAAGASGGFLAPTQGFGTLGLGFGNQYYRNNSTAPTVVTFSLAAPAFDVTLGIDVIALDSWDGDDAYWGVDVLSIRSDDRTLLEGSISNFPGRSTQTFPVLQQIVAPDADRAVNGSYSDSAYRFTFALGNLGAGTHTISIVGFSGIGGTVGYQAGDDESFAIDNVLVTSAVPEPAPWLLTAGGLVLLALVRQRR